MRRVSRRRQESAAHRPIEQSSAALLASLWSEGAAVWEEWTDGGDGDTKGGIGSCTCSHNAPTP